MYQENGVLKILDYDRVHACLVQVVANAVAAIGEIMETSGSARDLLEFNQQTANKLLTALNECTE